MQSHFAISGTGTRVAESFEGDPVSAAVLNIIAVTPDDGSTALQVCDTLPPAGNEEVQLFHLGTYATGLFDESAAEIVAFDEVTGNLVFVNANANTVSILDISNPKAPALVNEINMDAYGRWCE